MVQRTFLSALIHPYFDNRGASPFTWLTQLLKWETYSYYNEQNGDIPFDSLVEFGDLEYELGMSHLSLERMVDASLCIKRLPIGLRRLAFQYFIEGYTRKELAEMYGKKERHIKYVIMSIVDRFREPNTVGQQTDQKVLEQG